MKHNQIANDKSIDINERAAATRTCEAMIASRYTIIEEMNKYYDHIKN